MGCPRCSSRDCEPEIMGSGSTAKVSGAVTCPLPQRYRMAQPLQLSSFSCKLTTFVSFWCITDLRYLRYLPNLPIAPTKVPYLLRTIYNSTIYRRLSRTCLVLTGLPTTSTRSNSQSLDINPPFPRLASSPLPIYFLICRQSQYLQFRHGISLSLQRVVMI